MTHYQFVHYTDITKSYDNVLEQVQEEWKRLSYLVPDNLHGYGYLEAVKRVFG